MANQIDPILSALADPTRRQVIDLLKDRPMRAGELADAFPISSPALSRHLKVLRQAGLIEEQRQQQDNRIRVFQLRQDSFRTLNDWLIEVETFWQDQLGSFKAQAEATFKSQFESDDHP